MPPRRKKTTNMVQILKKAQELNATCDNIVDTNTKDNEDTSICDFTNIDTNDEQLVLKTQLTSCMKLITVAINEYMDKPIQSNAYALTSFIQTSQNILKDLSFYDKNDNKVKELVENVIHPFMRSIVKIFGEEISDVLERISDPEIRKLFNKMSHNFGSKMNIEYSVVISRLENIFNCTLSDSNSHISNNVYTTKQINE